MGCPLNGFHVNIEANTPWPATGQCDRVEVDVARIESVKCTVSFMGTAEKRA